MVERGRRLEWWWFFCEGGEGEGWTGGGIWTDAQGR